MLLEHLTGIHAVDVVGPEDAEVVRAFVADDVEVLEDGVGRSCEPAGSAAHLGRDRRHIVAEQGRHRPGPADVKIQAVALVLGEDDDAQESGVGEVREDEVDQPVLAAKRHGGLGSIEGQRQQPLAFAACEDDGQHLGHCRYRSSRLSPEYAVGQGARSETDGVAGRDADAPAGRPRPPAGTWWSARSGPRVAAG